MTGSPPTFGLPLTDDAIAAYRRDGVVMLRGVFDAAMRAALAAGMAAAERRPSERSALYTEPGSDQRFFYDAPMWGDRAEFDAVAAGSPAAEIAARLMGGGHARYFYTSIFHRDPDTARRTPWHQDGPFWCARGLGISSWTPLDPLPRDCALEFVRGSHAWGVSYMRPDFSATVRAGYLEDDAVADTPLPDIEADRDAFDIVAWDMAPGDCVLFGSMTLHGGCAVLPAGQGLRAVSMQWLGDDAVYDPHPGGTDPDVTPAIEAHGIRLGDAIDCPSCPVLWPRAA